MNIQSCCQTNTFKLIKRMLLRRMRRPQKARKAEKTSTTTGAAKTRVKVENTHTNTEKIQKQLKKDTFVCSFILYPNLPVPRVPPSST